MSSNPEPEGSPRLMTVSEIAEQYGISRQAIHAHRRRGTFPHPVQGEGSTRLRFRADEVKDFFERNPKQPGRRTDRAPQPQQGETMANDGLVAFLRARLDEDEQTAREALKRTTTTRRMIRGEMVEDTVQRPEWRRSVWPPARVLREVEAKRRMLELHQPVQKLATGSAGGTIEDCRTCDHFPAHYPCPTLRLLALPYADHPGYRPDWRL